MSAPLQFLKMKLILFSNPDNGTIEGLEKEILPKSNLVFGYMPADGNNPKPEFTPFWKEFAKRNKAGFLYLDNSKKPTKDELEDIRKIDSLFVAGGNVYNLLDNVKKSGYDKIIKGLARNKDFIYSGFSAGAILATSNIRVAAKDNNWSFGYDEDSRNTQDTRALGLVDFEILPHYEPRKDDENIKGFEKRYNTKLKPITDLQHLIVTK